MHGVAAAINAFQLQHAKGFDMGAVGSRYGVDEGGARYSLQDVTESLDEDRESEIGGDTARDGRDMEGRRNRSKEATPSSGSGGSGEREGREGRDGRQGGRVGESEAGGGGEGYYDKYNNNTHYNTQHTQYTVTQYTDTQYTDSGHNRTQYSDRHTDRNPLSLGSEFSNIDSFTGYRSISEDGGVIYDNDIIRESTVINGDNGANNDNGPHMRKGDGEGFGKGIFDSNPSSLSSNIYFGEGEAGERVFSPLVSAMEGVTSTSTSLSTSPMDLTRGKAMGFIGGMGSMGSAGDSDDHARGVSTSHMRRRMGLGIGMGVLGGEEDKSDEEGDPRRPSSALSDPVVDYLLDDNTLLTTDTHTQRSGPLDRLGSRLGSRLGLILLFFRPFLHYFFLSLSLSFLPSFFLCCFFPFFYFLTSY